MEKFIIKVSEKKVISDLFVVSLFKTLLNLNIVSFSYLKLRYNLNDNELQNYLDKLKSWDYIDIKEKTVTLTELAINSVKLDDERPEAS